MATTTTYSDRGSKQLTDKERVFVDQYLVDLDIRKAALRSGYGAKSAATTGHSIINRPHVKRAIGKLLKEHHEEVELTTEEVLKQLYYIVTRDIREFVDEDGIAIPINKLNDRAAQSVDGFDQEITDFTNEFGTTRTIKNKLKLVGKAGAIDMAMKYQGLFNKDNEQKQPTITLDFSKLYQPHIEANDPVAKAMENLEETPKGKLTIEVDAETRKPVVKNKPITIKKSKGVKK